MYFFGHFPFNRLPPFARLFLFLYSFASFSSSFLDCCDFFVCFFFFIRLLYAADGFVVMSLLWRQKIQFQYTKLNRIHFYFFICSCLAFIKEIKRAGSLQTCKLYAKQILWFLFNLILCIVKFERHYFHRGLWRPNTDTLIPSGAQYVIFLIEITEYLKSFSCPSYRYSDKNTDDECAIRCHCEPSLFTVFVIQDNHLPQR